MNGQIKSRRFARDLLLSTVLLLLLVVAFAAYNWSVQRVDQAHKLRYRSYLLADMLRQSGDDLTRMVRTYVATGDPSYKQHFQNILNIREGKLPAPKNYWRPYWDLVLTGAPPPRGNGKAMPLLELMRQAGFTDEEFRKLATAKAKSDALTIPELEAMKLVETTGPAAGKNWAKAQRMLYDDKYHQAKAGVMKLIDEFYVLVDQRTLTAVRIAETQATVLQIAFGVTGLGLLFMLWRTYVALQDTLGGPLGEVHAQIARIGGGDFSLLLNRKAVRANSVLGWLAVTQDKLNEIASQRKLAEEALRTSAAYTRNLLEASLDPLVTISAAGRITDVNEASELATGVPREKLIGTDFADCFSEPEKARAGCQRAFAEGFVRDYLLAIRHVSGRVTEVLFNASVYRNPQGEVSGVFAAARDITECRRAEASVRESEERFRSVVEGSAIAIFVSLDMNFTYLNPAALRLLGAASSAQLTGQPVLSRIHPDYHESIKQRAAKVFVGQRGVAPPQEEIYVRLDGSSVPVEVTASPIIYQGQRGAVVFVQDITQRKRSEDLLRAAAAYARNLLDTSLDPLVTISAEGKITDVNDALVQATGLPRPKLIGTDFSDYFTEPAKAREGYQRVFSAGFVRDYPLAIRHVAGRVTEVLYNATVYRDGNGQVLGAFAAARDITALKQVEREIRQLNGELEHRVGERTAQLDAANKELEAFCYSVSHDLHAPLRAIGGFSRALLEDYEEKLDGKGRDSLRRVMAAAQRMDHLIDDLLMLSRITQEQMHFGPVNLSALARTVGGEVQQAAPDKPVELVIAPDVIRQGDAGLLRIVLENLLGNAWKFTGKQAAARVEFGQTERDGMTVCFVRDNGAGFDMAYADKLFGAFQRLHKAREFPGTGIGLATVRRIVHRHGGRIWAEAQVGKGATFYFTLLAPLSANTGATTTKENHHEKENQNHRTVCGARARNDSQERVLPFQPGDEARRRGAKVGAETQPCEAPGR